MDMETKEPSKKKAIKIKNKKVHKERKMDIEATESSKWKASESKNRKHFKKDKSFPSNKVKNGKIKPKKSVHFEKGNAQNGSSENTETEDKESHRTSVKRKSEEGESPPSKQMKLHNLKFKERKLKRKQQKKKVLFDVVKLLKTYWEDLRREDCSPDKKSQLLKQISNIISGNVKKFAFAHDTTRVLECVFAEGTEEHRTLIFQEIKEKDDLINLSKSKYGKFLVMKILRYGMKSQKEAVMAAFNGNVTKLMRHVEAAEVVEFAFNECANAMQRFEMIQEFYGPSYRLFKESNIHNLTELLEAKPETKESVIRSMKEELMKCLEKSVVKHSLIHHVLLQFFLNCDSNSRSEFIESLREVVPEILHTKDGSRVAMQCVWYGDNKDRKIIIKKMKTFVKKIAMEEYGHMVLLALFDCVDDTTLIDKVVIKELLENLLEVAQSIHGKKVLIYLLNPRDPHYFHPGVINILKKGDNNATSKKDPEKRQDELKKAIAQPLTELIIKNIADLYRNNAFCLFVATVLKHTIADRREAFESIAKLACEPYTSENKSVHLIENSGSFFMLKQLIQADNPKTNSVTFSEVFVNTIPDGVMKTWFYCNRGAFLLVNLLETEIPAVINKIKNELMGCHKQINKLNFKGAELLIQKLKKVSVNTSSE